MCGRFSATFTWDDLKAWWPIENDMALNWSPRFNIAPGQDICTVGLSIYDEWKAAWIHWGVPLKPRLLINARRESIADKPLFRHAYQHNRVIVPADVFYEWKRPGRQPFRFTLDRPFAMAAILVPYADRTWHVVLLTTPADDSVSRVHDRMPWVLSPGQVPIWLNRLDHHYSELKVMPVKWQVYPVTTRLNQVKNDDPDLILPIGKNL